LIDGFIYAIFGGCKDLNIGPTSILSLMLQPHVTQMGADAAVLMTFLSGIIIFVLGVLQLGTIKTNLFVQI
jgi:sodium-independent sulfate anion transporter 11